jgi:hypothetical protein
MINTGGPSAAGETSTKNPNEKLEGPEALQAYLDSPDSPVTSSRGTLAGLTSSLSDAECEERLKNSSWVKAFDKGVKEAVGKLGPNPTKGEVDKAVNNEFFKQKIMKFAMDRASNRIMDKIKENMQDTFK